MKIFHAVLTAAAAGFVFAAADAYAGPASADFNAKRVGVDSSITLMQNRGDTFQDVRYEGNRKIITTYRAVGTRKVGLVGGQPYGVHRNSNLTHGGHYYTQDGVKYFRNTRDLHVTYQGSFNN